MTKLTKEQIEQERVKFEEWFRVHYAISPNCLMILNSFAVSHDSSRNYYGDFATNENFKSWLARAELDKGE